MSSGSFYSRYKAAILFNKNLIVSGIAGFFASAYVSQLYAQYDADEFINSVVAVSTEYAVYLPLFGALFYIDNRDKYIDQSTRKRNKAQIRNDIKKLFASFGVSEIVFSIVRFGSQYGLLTLELQAYEASMLSSLAAWAVFFVSVNIMARLTRLHKREY
jgi:hypothetical protein